MQNEAWGSYAHAIKRNLQSLQGMWQTMQPALAKLYEVLSAEQKKKADELLTGMAA